VGTRGAVLALAFLLLAAAGCGGGDEKGADPLPAAPEKLNFTSPEIKDGGTIPVELTCDGAGKTPTITWQGAIGTELVLFVQDTDADFTHWTAYNISAAGGAGLAPDGQFPTGTKYGKNSAGKTGWTPPCPPKGDDPHHYVFSMYVLSDATGLADGAEPDAVLAKVKNATASGTFTGTYARTRKE